MAKRPKWLDRAVFYEIYPQSFLDTDGDGIGNINGITRKLGYIKELGCTALWLNPCFDSPFGDAGYDVSDYCRVAPRYGTNEDLIQLFEEAHKLDMHILLDLVPGHTSWEHPWFLKSKKAGRNEYTDRYVWTDSIWEEPVGYGSLRGISDRDGSENAGFSSAPADRLYIPIDPAPERPTAEAEMKAPDSLRSEVKKLIAVRMAHKALQSLGEIEFLCDGAPGRPLAYIRSFEDEHIAVIVNPGANDYEQSLPGNPGEVIYSFGAKPSLKENTVKICGKSVVFVSLP